MSQNGTHTWDLTLQYHRCPKCGYIIESREDYTYRNGKWTKQLTCDRCKEQLLIEKQQKLTLGPLIGMPQPPEITWE